MILYHNGVPTKDIRLKYRTYSQIKATNDRNRRDNRLLKALI